MGNEFPELLIIHSTSPHCPSSISPWQSRVRSPVMRSNRPLQRCTTGPRTVEKSLVTQEQTPITGRRCCHTSSTVYRFGGNERHRQRPGDDGFASHNKPFPLRVQLSRESLGQSRAKQSKRVMKCEGHSAKVPQEIRTVAASKMKLIN